MRDLYAAKFRQPGQRLPDIVGVDSREFYGEGYEDSDRRIPDITKAKTLLGWQPKYGLDETIERSMAGFVPYASTPTSRF
jgi:UDP-apiose/xylose synthase